MSGSDFKNIIYRFPILSNGHLRLLLLLFLCCCVLNTSALGQRLSRIEPGISLGNRNSGLLVNYRISQQVSADLGINFIRYNNLELVGRVKYFFLKKMYRDPDYGSSPFVGVGYSHVSKARFNNEDSREFVNSFHVPSNKFVLAEIGYKYIFSPDKNEVESNKGKIGCGFSVSCEYWRGLEKSYSSSLARGSDIDGEVNKINRFMKGGIGFGLGLVIVFRNRDSSN